MSTLELQLASFQVCVVCRGVRTLRVTVDKGMPSSLWGDHDTVVDPYGAQDRRRLPPLRAAGAVWIIPIDVFVPVVSEAPLLRHAETMQLADTNCTCLDSRIDALTGRERLRQLVAEIDHSPKGYFQNDRTFPRPNVHGRENASCPGQHFLAARTSKILVYLHNGCVLRLRGGSEFPGVSCS